MYNSTKKEKKQQQQSSEDHDNMTILYNMCGIIKVRSYQMIKFTYSNTVIRVTIFNMNTNNKTFYFFVN